jgi:hypothetical protein
VRAHDLEADAADRLEHFAPRDEGWQHEIAEPRVLEQKRAQRLALDGDVAKRLGDDRGDEHGLAGQEIELAEKAGRESRTPADA